MPIRLSHLLGRVKAAHLGHLQVYENDVVALFPDRPNGLGSAFGDIQVVPLLPQHGSILSENDKPISYHHIQLPFPCVMTVNISIIV